MSEKSRIPRSSAASSADDFERRCAGFAGVPTLADHPGFEIVGDAGHGDLLRWGAQRRQWVASHLTQRTRLVTPRCRGAVAPCRGHIPLVRGNPGLGADTRLIRPYSFNSSTGGHLGGGDFARVGGGVRGYTRSFSLAPTKSSPPCTEGPFGRPDVARSIRVPGGWCGYYSRMATRNAFIPAVSCRSTANCTSSRRRTGAARRTLESSHTASAARRSSREGSARPVCIPRLST